MFLLSPVRYRSSHSDKTAAERKCGLAEAISNKVIRFYKQQHRKLYVKKTVGSFTSELNTKLDKANTL